jgi:hypothetical protein
MNQVLSEGAIQGGKFNAFMGEHKFRILEAGRAVQDFAQGGVAGILNNIERLVGGSGALAGILTAVGVAAYIAYPFIKEWAEGLGALGDKFAPTKERLDALTDSIKKNKEEIGELEKQQKLSYFELSRYSKLVGETAKMEEEAANAKAARAVKPGSSKAMRERAASVQEAIAEGFGSSDLLIESIMDTDEGKATGQKRVEEIVADALKGFAGATDDLTRKLPKFREEYEKVSPETKARNKLAQENFKKEQASQREREKKLSDEEEAEDRETQRAANEVSRELAAMRQKEAAADREDASRIKQAENMELAQAKRDRRQAGQQAIRSAQDLQRANDRANQDMEYWTKVNNGMITAADQISRRTELLRRNTEDTQRRVQESMMQGNDG